VRRNYRLGVANGTMLRLFTALADPALVLTWFVSGLGASPLVIGLLAPINNGGWFLPQLLMSGFIQRQPRKMPIYRLSVAIRSVCWFLLTGLVFALGHSNPTLLLGLFLLLYTVFCFLAGVAGLPFLDIIAKGIPARRRGSFFAWREFTGGVLALGGSALVRYVLDERSGLAFPDNFGLLLAIGGLAAGIGYVAFAQMAEPADAAVDLPPSSPLDVRVVWNLLRREPNFAMFALVRVALLASTIAVPFYSVFAKERLRAPTAMVGTYVGAFTVALVLSTLVWGRLSERHGNRAVVWATSLLSVPLTLVPLLLGARMSYSAFAAVYALLGVAQSGAEIGCLSFELDLAPAGQRPLYIGLLNTMLGVVSFALILGGVVVSQWGLEAVFAVSVGCAIVSFAAIHLVREPSAC
jgi:MFS family permease